MSRHHCLSHPGSPRTAVFPVLPAAVFADPQVASADATERVGRGVLYIHPALTEVLEQALLKL